MMDRVMLDAPLCHSSGEITLSPYPFPKNRELLMRFFYGEAHHVSFVLQEQLDVFGHGPDVIRSGIQP